MNLFKIVMRNIGQRKLSSVLTMFSISLGVAVAAAILSLQHQAENTFRADALGYHMIIGARGSSTQLVLNTVFHLDKSPGNISYDWYGRIKKHRDVALAAPIAVGDSYQGFRVVGTTQGFLNDFEVRPGQPLEFQQGKSFSTSDDGIRRAFAEQKCETYSAVLGATAAQETRLTLGAHFSPTHGLEENDGAHDEKWTVVGILNPTGTPSDRAIYINLESFLALPAHIQEKPGISAIVVKTRFEKGAPQLEGEINASSDAMAALPVHVVSELLGRLAPIGPMMLVISVFVILVAGISILVSIYNSMAERSRSIAIMRALGARRTLILWIILCEATLLCVIGGLAGIVLGHVLIAAAAPALHSMAGILISPWVFLPSELILLGALSALGMLVGVIPALRAYKVEIADGIIPT